VAPSRGLACGLLGWPARHSLSPAMHHAAFAAVGVEGFYLAFEVPPPQLAAAVAGLAALGFEGCNLTVPHKEAGLGACTRLDAEARRLGAVNTLTFADGVITGHNTDGAGFRRALAIELGCDPRDARVVVFGAGGVARAVVGTLAQAGAGDLALCARTPARAAALLESLAGGRGRVVEWTAAAAGAALARADLVVSCLPPEAPPPGLAALPASAAVLDVVYGRETPLLGAARAVGARAAGGLEMLVQQGALAFTLWTGQAAPVDVMRAAAQAELRARG
jgi:shikimate dehydrogenase